MGCETQGTSLVWVEGSVVASVRLKGLEDGNMKMGLKELCCANGRWMVVTSLGGKKSKERVWKPCESFSKYEKGVVSGADFRSAEFAPPQRRCTASRVKQLSPVITVYDAPTK
jgi:hypothetical protein